MNTAAGNDSPPNPHPFRLSEGDTFGFSDAGERVPVAWPEIASDEKESGAGFDPEFFLTLLISGAKSRNEIAERVLCLAYLMPGVDCRPKTLNELGLWLDVSHVTARARLTRFRRDFIEQFEGCLTKPPLCEDEY